VSDLDFNADDYPGRFNSFKRLVFHIKGLRFRLKTLQHSIRRYEFDDYLLKRSGADVFTHRVRSIEKSRGAYTIDGEYRCQYLVGAGGTRCPVYKEFFRQRNPRAAELQVVTLEQEFRYDWKDPDCHLWFFLHGLPGYSWYVPKANGYLNCGIGGMAEKLSQSEDGIRSHWNTFVARLVARSLLTGTELEPKGYSYYLRRDVDHVRVDNAFITGDAAGLATRDMGEGIGPAIESGLHAADAITTGCEYSLSGLGRHSLPDLARSRRLVS